MEKSLIHKIKVNMNKEKSYWPHVKYRERDLMDFQSQFEHKKNNRQNPTEDHSTQTVLPCLLLSRSREN